MELEILSGRVATLEKLIVQIAKWTNFNLKQLETKSSKPQETIRQNDEDIELIIIPQRSRDGQKQKSTARKSTTRHVAISAKKTRSSMTRVEAPEEIVDGDVVVKTEQDDDRLDCHQENDFVLGDIPFFNENSDEYIDPDEDIDFEGDVKPGSFDLDFDPFADSEPPSDTNNTDNEEADDVDVETVELEKSPVKQKRMLPSQEELQKLSSKPVQVLSSNKGRPMLVVDGFVFSFDGKGKTKMAWRCEKSVTSLRCKARIHTTTTSTSTSTSTANKKFQNVKVIYSRGVHSHDPPTLVHVNGVLRKKNDWSKAKGVLEKRANSDNGRIHQAKNPLNPTPSSEGQSQRNPLKNEDSANSLLDPDISNDGQNSCTSNGKVHTRKTKRPDFNLPSEEERQRLASKRVRVVTSCRQRPMLFVSGFVYRFEGLGTDKTIWQCTTPVDKNGKSGQRCPGRIYTTNETETEKLEDVTVLLEVGRHAHDPPIVDEDQDGVLKIRRSNHRPKRRNKKSSRKGKRARVHKEEETSDDDDLDADLSDDD